MKIVFDTEYEKFQFEGLIDSVFRSTGLDKERFDVDVADVLAKIVVRVMDADRSVKRPDYLPPAEGAGEGGKPTALALPAEGAINKFFSELLS